jgi:transcriptional regulator of acetoin/glycerol metabolism
MQRRLPGPETLARMRRKLRVQTLNQLKRAAMSRVSKVADGDHMLAAKLLAVGKTTLYRWQRAFNLRSPRVRASFGETARLKKVPRLSGRSGVRTLQELRGDEIARVLQITSGNAYLTAELLEVGTGTVYRHIRSNRAKRDGKENGRPRRKLGRSPKNKNEQGIVRR